MSHALSHAILIHIDSFCQVSSGFTSAFGLSSCIVNELTNISLTYSQIFPIIYIIPRIFQYFPGTLNPDPSLFPSCASFREAGRCYPATAFWMTQSVCKQMRTGVWATRRNMFIHVHQLGLRPLTISKKQRNPSYESRRPAMKRQASKYTHGCSSASAHSLSRHLLPQSGDWPRAPKGIYLI